MQPATNSAVNNSNGTNSDTQNMINVNMLCTWAQHEQRSVTVYATYQSTSVIMQ